MSERLTIGELDLLAYADDPLGLEPRRRRAIESHLSAHPEDAERVEAFRRQNQALRERYDRYFHAPVPPRLYDALDAPPARGRRLLRHATAACMIAAAALAGWLAGERYGGPAMVALNDEAPQPAAVEGAGAPVADAAQPVEPVAVAGLFEYSAGMPDLGHLGFSLVEAEPEPVADGSAEVVRLSYAGEDGRQFDLLLRSRWDERNPGFQVEKRDGLSVVSWEEGRLAAELTSGVGREEALEIAEAVRKALSGLAPAGRAPADGVLAVGPSDAAEPAEPGAPLLPQQIQ